MIRITLCTFIFCASAFAADPHHELRLALQFTMTPEEIDRMIQDDMNAQKALVKTDNLAAPTHMPVPDSFDQDAFRKKMAALSRNAKFGNLGI